MGRSAQMYVGPVAIFDKIPKTISIEKYTEPSCVNESCKRYNLVAKNTRHCHECGCTMGSILLYKDCINSSAELLEVTDFMQELRVINQQDCFRQKVVEVGFLNEVLVVGAFDDDKLSDVEEVDNYTEVLFLCTLEEMSDMMRRFAYLYVAILDKYVSVIGPYKLVWSTNIASS